MISSYEPDHPFPGSFGRAVRLSPFTTFPAPTRERPRHVHSSQADMGSRPGKRRQGRLPPDFGAGSGRAHEAEVQVHIVRPSYRPSTGS
jgi:hypothetical protein